MCGMRSVVMFISSDFTTCLAALASLVETDFIKEIIMGQH